MFERKISLRICSLLTMKTQNRAKEFVLRYIAIYSFFELHSCPVFLIPTWEGFFLLVRRHYTEAINCLFLLTWQHIIGQILHTDDIKWNVSTYKKTEKGLSDLPFFWHLQSSDTTASTQRSFQSQYSIHIHCDYYFSHELLFYSLITLQVPTSSWCSLITV